MAITAIPARLGPIQLNPQGFTGLFQLKELGRQPAFFEDNIRASVEMRDWYMQSRQLANTGLFGTSTPITANIVTGNRGYFPFQVGSGTFVIPQGVTWYVEHFCVTCGTVAAADTFTMAPCIQTADGADFIFTGPQVADVATANQRTITMLSPRSFWARPGDSFGVWVVNATVGTSVNAGVHMRATPMPL